MTRARAIEIIGRYDVNFCTDDGKPIRAEELTDAFEAALDALRAQEPVPPSFDSKWRGVPVYLCGHCGHLISCTKGYFPKYCAGCGRKVKWDV